MATPQSQEPITQTADQPPVTPASICQRLAEYLNSVAPIGRLSRDKLIVRAGQYDADRDSLRDVTTTRTSPYIPRGFTQAADTALKLSSVDTSTKDMNPSALAQIDTRILRHLKPGSPQSLLHQLTLILRELNDAVEMDEFKATFRRLAYPDKKESVPGRIDLFVNWDELVTQRFHAENVRLQANQNLIVGAVVKYQDKLNQVSPLLPQSVTPGR